MGRIRDNLLWVSLVALLVSGGLLVVVLGSVGLVVYTALVTGTPIVDTLLDVALPTLVVTGVLLVASVFAGVGFAWALVGRMGRTSIPRSERLAGLAERAEREYTPLRIVGLSDLLSPPEPSAEERAEDALAALKRRYVEGDIDEREFERTVDRLVANDSVDEVRAERERRDAIRDRHD